MNTINANDLKTKGIAAIESALSNEEGAIVSVRGKGKFIIMDLVHYQYLRECELEAAIAASKSDIEAGKFKIMTAAEHIAHMDKML